jgi:hypothetical protein
MSGVHDVWLMPSTECDFAAPGAKELSPASAAQYTATLTAPGTFYYACSFPGHCDAGQVLSVTVSENNSQGADACQPSPPSPPLPTPVQPPPNGNAPTSPKGGTCAPPTTDPATGLVTVSCLTPAVALAPGDNVYPNVALPNAYPVDGEVAVVALSADVVDATGRAVPLNEVILLLHIS